MNPTPPQYNYGPSSGQYQVARQFPPEFGIYSQTFGRQLHIGEHKDHPLYAVSIHSALSSQPSVVLHGGPDKSHPMMASTNFRAFSNKMTVTLPPGPSWAGASSTEEVDTKHVHLRTNYVFSVDVGGRRETFEWRHSSGDAVSAVGGDHFGWKLVRMASGPSPGGFRANDGREVVAAWSNMTMRGHKAAKFMFMGTGASGMLGERWAVMAVITALGIFEKEREAKSTADAGGG